MSRTNRPIVLYDPALPQDAQDLVKRQGPFDVVVGIPSHRNARTIAEVVAAASEGIATYLPDQRVLLMNADGGSSDNTCRFLEDLEAPANVTKLVCVYDGAIGKGNGVRAIMEAAALSDARACALLDARCPGIAPEWLPALVNPVLGGGDMVVATYDRTRSPRRPLPTTSPIPSCACSSTPTCASRWPPRCACPARSPKTW